MHEDYWGKKFVADVQRRAPDNPTRLNQSVAHRGARLAVGESTGAKAAQINAAPEVGEPTGAVVACPFCQSRAAFRDTNANIPGKIMHQMRCRGCGARTAWFNSADQAINAWTFRAAPNEKQAAVEWMGLLALLGDLVRSARRAGVADERVGGSDRADKELAENYRALTHALAEIGKARTLNNDAPPTTAPSHHEPEGRP